MAEYSFLRSNKVIDAPYSTIPERLKRWAREIPDKEAFVFVGPDSERNAITFGKLYTRALTFAKGLVRTGIMKGDMVGIAGQNSQEWLVSTFGAQMAGASPLHFTFGQADGNDIIDVLKKSGTCKMIIAHPGMDDGNVKILNNIADCVSENGVVSSKRLPDLKWIVLQKDPKHPSSIPSIDSIMSKGKENDNQLPKIDPEDIAAILLTSGSTGEPKSVPYSHFDLLLSGSNINSMLAHKEKTDDRGEIYYNDRPFFWIGGYPHWLIFSGGTRITQSNLLGFSSLPDAVSFASKTLENELVTSALFIPPYLSVLLQKKDIPWKLRTILTGGMVVSASYLQCIGQLCDQLSFLYASTEFGGCIFRTYTSADVSFRHDCLVGQPFPGVEVKVVDSEGLLAPINQLGEIYVRSSVRFAGYLNNDEKTKEALTRSMWFKTGDCGYITDDNMLFISDRMRDVIVVSTIMISPSIIENIIKGHPDVLDVIVFGNKDEHTQDDVPCAAVLRRIDSSVNAEGIRQHIRTSKNIKDDSQMLETFYVPKYITFFENFQRTATGKVDRKAIIQLVKDKIVADRC